MAEARVRLTWCVFAMVRSRSKSIPSGEYLSSAGADGCGCGCLSFGVPLAEVKFELIWDV